MSKEISEEFFYLARQIEEQLKFYREIGVTDIGGSALTLKPAARADSIEQTAIAATKSVSESDRQMVETSPLLSKDAPRDENIMPRKKEAEEQVSLFEDLMAGPETTARAGVIEAEDISLEAIREDLGECIRCKLHEHRNNIVFGEGNPKAKIVFVGEGPGADEDATGRPFVGRAGQLLDKIIHAIGLRREEVYITNIVKCRPPGNRTPERDEVATCEQFLFRQLAVIKPALIVTLGSPAFQCLLKTKEPISRSRGEWREWNGIRVMPTFHPAYLLRVPEKKREAWEDMKKVRDFLNSLSD